MQFTPEQRAKGIAKRQEALEALRATTKELNGGARIYKDSPPGVGWVLEMPGNRKHYYATAQIAEDQWNQTWSKGYLLAVA